MKKRRNALAKDFFMEIKKSKGRFLSIFFIVALGVSLFVGIRATEPDMRLSGDAYVDENKLMDIKIVSPYGFTEDDIAKIKDLSTIDEAVGAYSADILCDVEGDKKVLHVMSKTTDLNLITIEEGRLPEEKEECLVDKDFLKKSGYKVGDKITFETEESTAVEGVFTNTEFTIVGSGSSPCYFALDRGNSTIGNGSVSGFAIVLPDAFAYGVYTEIFTLVDGAKESVAFTDEYDEKVEEAIVQIREAEAEWKLQFPETESPVWYVFDRSSIPEYTGYGDNAERIAALAVVFPSIFFLVAALISLTTMTRMVEEQRVQIGTLKGLGYSNWAIMRKYMFYALLATGGGSLLGVLVGEKIFPYVIIVAYKIMYVNIPQVLIPYHWGYGIMATLIAVACTGLATLVACYKELLAQPAVLMRPEAPKVGKRTWIEKVTVLWRMLSFSWKSSLRNLFRYKKRFFMTLIGIGGCMGLLLVGYGLRDSITSVATIQYDDLQTYEISVYLSEGMEESARKELQGYLDGQPNISDYMNVRMSTIQAQNRDEDVDAYLTVVSDLEKIDDFFVYQDRVSDEKYHLSNEGVIISEKTAEMLGADVGDAIELTDNGINPKKVKISAICENYVGHYVYMTKQLYEEVYEEELFCNNILIKADASEKELGNIGEDILEFDSILNVQYTRDLSSRLNDMLGALDRVIIVLIVVAGMLSFVVLYNLNNINITERRRELATLKVLGFHDIEVAMYVYRENILLTLLGAIIGCGIGKFLHHFTITTVEIDSAMFGRDINLASYLISALFTFGFSLLVNWIMYFKLKKIDMVESLKSVE